MSDVIEAVRAELPGWQNLSVTMIGPDASIAGIYLGRPHAAWSGNRNPGDPVEYARYLHTLALAEAHKDALMAATVGDMNFTLAATEESDAETRRTDHDGGPAAGDGDRSEPTAATDRPDPAGSGLGLASAQAEPEDQSGAANAVAEPLDAHFSEPEEPPPQAQADASEPSGGVVIEGHKPAEPPAYGGTLIDDTRERLAAQVDEAAKPRIEACDTIIRNTPMQEINNARMLGQVTDEQAAQEAAYYAAGSKRLDVVERARKIKEQIWKAGPEMLATINPSDPALWPT